MKLATASRARRGPIAGANPEHANLAVDLVEGRLGQVDRHASSRRTSGFLDHRAAELVVPPEQGRDREPIPGGRRGGRLRRALDGEANRFGPNHVDGSPTLSPVIRLASVVVNQVPRVGGARGHREGDDAGGQVHTL